jgi:sRNA-binding carbon storage regulator CsrA
MFVRSRKRGESIVVAENIRISIVETQGERVLKWFGRADRPAANR